MVEPTEILDKMRIVDPEERYRLLELIEVVLIALAVKNAGATESLNALNITCEILELELSKLHSFPFTHKPPPRSH